MVFKHYQAATTGRSKMKKAVKITVIGIVQGVGFRPFVYREAIRYNLKGYVINRGGSEVEIWIEGKEENIRKFLDTLEKEKPPPSLLFSVEVSEVFPRNYNKFLIRKSEKALSRYSIIPPDIGICGKCIQEIRDITSRWYNYPFNSCAWCGPRFSIMYGIPYDRENTSMRYFPLCYRCRSEYNDPKNDRRFHAQGISCPECGPRLWLTDENGNRIDADDPLREVAALIDEGNIIGIKGLGGFHIAALATDDDIVLELRRRKKRPQKPFALMALNVEIVQKISTPSSNHLEVLQSFERPIVLIPRRKDSPISKYVAPGLNTVGIMIPYTGIHYLLLSHTKDKFLIMTSGNEKGKPLIKDNENAIKRLKGIVDYFVLHNRVIVNRVDDSVVRFTDGKLTFLRRSRGYAPKWIISPFRFEKPVIALGAYLSNVGCIAFKNFIVPTQYVGDMEFLENIDFLIDSLKFLMSSYKVKWESSIIASDLHPSYTTTILAKRLASRYNVPHVMVQHHHAHIISVAIENGLSLKDDYIIGIAMDGVGYGSDGTIWGGEILLASFRDYHRLGRLEYLTQPFGDISTKYPLLLLLGSIFESQGEEGVIKFLNIVKDKVLPNNFNLDIFFNNYNNFPKASSVGRFLDAVAVVLGIHPYRTYEGELAMKLESIAYGGSLISSVKIECHDNIIAVKDLIFNLLNLKDKYSIHDIAYTVLYRLGEAFGMLADTFAKEYGSEYIAISGGAAVNDFIIKGIKRNVRRKLIFNKELPPGDGNISVGQVAIAAFQD